VKGELATAYSKAGVISVNNYQNWALFNKAPYVADTHGRRLANNYANKVGEKAYGRYEKVGKIPVGSIAAKDSCALKPGRKIAFSTLFFMEKIDASRSKAKNNWRYSMIFPNGSIMGATGGKNSKAMQFCHDCHGPAENEDSLFSYLKS
jgi:hypothetical protein